jgi:hypothetical protein
MAASSAANQSLCDIAQSYARCAAHVAFPGLGHVAKAGDGYAWVPVNYPQPL